MQSIFILVGRFISTALVTFVVASMTHSQFVVAGLTDIDIKIGLMDRLDMTTQDLLGLLPTLGSAISFSLALAFAGVVVLNKVYKSTKAYNIVLFPLAGYTAIWLMLAAMHLIMNTSIIAGSRTTFGMFCLCLSGGLGGYIYWRLTQKHAK